MRGVNKAILVGRLGKDPEVRHLDGNSVVANFSIATSESYKNKEGNRVESTEWHNIVLWGRLAEIAEQYLKKGDAIYIEGRLQTRSWEDQQGVKKYTTEIVGSNLQMLGGRNDGQSSGGGSTTSAQPQQAAQPQQQPAQSQDANMEDPGDDLPF